MTDELHKTRLRRAAQSLQGLSCGDAFGERFFLPESVVASLIRQRALPAPPWFFTDDTVMALSVLETLAEHSEIGPRYGKVIEQLPAAIRYVLRFDYPTAMVFEEIQPAKTRYLGAGMAVFVNDEFLQKVKTTPLFWIAPELTKRIVVGKSPLLTDAEVRDANSTTGLNLMMLGPYCGNGRATIRQLRRGKRRYKSFSA